MPIYVPLSAMTKPSVIVWLAISAFALALVAKWTKHPHRKGCNRSYLGMLFDLATISGVFVVIGISELFCRSKQ